MHEPQDQVEIPGRDHALDLTCQHPNSKPIFEDGLETNERECMDCGHTFSVH